MNKLFLCGTQYHVLEAVAACLESLGIETERNVCGTGVDFVSAKNM